MSYYIERDALCDAILNLPPKMYANGYAWLGRRDVWQMIVKFPAADVVEVVRCKECKYVEPTKGADKDKLPHFCTIHREKFYDGEEYCSFGRRKE